MQGRNRKGLWIAILAILVSALSVIGVGALSAANAAVVTAPTTVTATTHITDRPDSGAGGNTWAYDTLDRTLTVTADPANNQTNLLAYTATVSDTGTFDSIAGVRTPNQSTPGTLIAHGVSGTISGGISYTILAPNTDTLTGVVPATEADNFGTPAETTGNWPVQAFKSVANVQVKEGTDWSWTYKTACESWTDAANNGNGNIAVDGNITGKNCPAPAVTPYVYGGNVVTVNNNRATVGWSNGGDWPNKSQCVEVWISGYGFGAWNQMDPTNPGTSHVGFTCNNGDQTKNLGYLSGLAAGHTYALRIVPATGSYGAGNNKPIPGANVGYVDVFTTR